MGPVEQKTSASVIESLNKCAMKGRIQRKRDNRKE
jgi:hypothetical protein